MKKIISLVLVGLIGISIIPKTLINERHTVLESTTSVYTKEEVDSLLSAIRTNITNNTNELTNIKSELTTLQNSLKDYALKTSLNTTNSNVDGLNTVASSNASKITSLETLYSGGNATASQILKGKTAIVGSKQVTGTIESLGATTYTPTTSNQTIASGKYLSGAQTIAGDADLISANIKSGAEIFGVKGNSNVVDTSAGTATASQILSGKIAFVDGSKVTGTIESLGATTYTPTTSNQTIASGKYLSGAQTIAGDADLISANIRSGAEIFGVKGNSNVVDTSAGTATASQILSGKIAFVDGSRVTGTMANKGTLNWKPTTSTTYTVPAGYYSGGTLDSSSAYQAGYDTGLAEGTSTVQPMTLSFSASRSAYSGKDVVITNNTTIDTTQYSKLTIDAAYIYGASASTNLNFVRVAGVDAVANVGKVIDLSSTNSVTVSLGRTDGLAANVTCTITLS